VRGHSPLFSFMKLTLQRGQIGNVSIPGELFCGGAHECWTLERKAVAIPAGTYQLGLYPSPHFSRLMPILKDVLDRQDILLHWGNYPANSDGCILLGSQRSLEIEEIYNTRAAFEELFPVIQAAVNTEGAEIEILDAQTTHTHEDDL
jgi:hypothetical protein